MTEQTSSPPKTIKASEVTFTPKIRRKASKFLTKFNKLNYKLEDIQQAKRDLLREYGWKESSDYPGAFWLWSKTFPESDVQWRWTASEKGPIKVPKEGCIINGASLDIALHIEASWQDHYTKNPT